MFYHLHFQMITQLITSPNVESIKQFKLLVLVCWVSSDLYLFHLIVLLNPVFNCSNNLLSSWVDKVTTGTYNFVSLILNVAPVGALISGTGALALGSASCVV